MSQEKSKKNKKKKIGTTLIEVLVYTALFGMVFTGIYMVFNAAVKYYYITQSNVWVQQSALGSINQLSRELAESSLSSVVLTKPIDNPNNHPGVVFMSPRTNSTATPVVYSTTSPDEGKVYWRKYICYYLDDDPQDSSKKVIFRNETDLLASPGRITPLTPPPHTTDDFATTPSLSASSKIVAHDVYFDPEHPYDPDKIGFKVYWLSGSTKTYGNTSSYTDGTPTNNTIYIYVKTQAQDTSLGKANTFETTSSINVGNL